MARRVSVCSHLIIEHQFDPLDINPTRRHVGRHENGNLATAECSERLLSLHLVPIAMHRAMQHPLSRQRPA